MMRIYLLGIIAVVAMPTCAAAAPAGLYGKSVIVTWSETRSQRDPGMQAFRPVSIPVEFTVYVSEQGRIFRRITSTSQRGRRGSKDKVGASGSAAFGAYAVQFPGSSMVANLSSGGYGSRIQVDFAPGFASCTARVIAAKEAGSQVIKKISPATGALVEIESISAGSANCSVSTGNAFAN
jgi:hypothetical protein